MDNLTVTVHNAIKAGILESHFHSCYEIYYLRRGRMRYIIADEIFEVGEGDVVLIPEGMIHNTVYHGIPTERYLINFPASYISDRSLLKCFETKHLTLSGKEIFLFEQLFDKLVKEKRTRDEYSKLLAGRYIEEMLIALLRGGKQKKSSPGDSYTEIMRSAMQYIGESYQTELTLDLLAAKYSLSRSFFSRKFREVTGFGLAEYITVVRIRNAAELLTKQGLSVTEAAFAVGYNDSSYFTSTFKRIMGVTPLKYAKSKAVT